MEFQHVDVFADDPFTGNSVTVFFGDGSLTADRLLAITKEFRHFESVFLEATHDPARWRARVFDLFEELDFAGHPLLGAAAVLHRRLGGDRPRTFTLDLPAKTVVVRTSPNGDGVMAVLDQGSPDFGQVVTGHALAPILDGLGLGAADLDPELEPAVVSTGLRYLVLPVTSPALDRAEIGVADFDRRLSAVGARFAYLLDPLRMEGRHWNNDGRIEDIATGSAAGTVGAYLARAGRVELNEPFVLRQGRHVGRPSNLCVTPEGPPGGEVTRVLISGAVATVATGTLLSLPGGGG